MWWMGGLSKFVLPAHKQLYIHWHTELTIKFCSAVNAALEPRWAATASPHKACGSHSFHCVVKERDPIVDEHSIAVCWLRWGRKRSWQRPNRTPRLAPRTTGKPHPWIQIRKCYTLTLVTRGCVSDWGARSFWISQKARVDSIRVVMLELKGHCVFQLEIFLYEDGRRIPNEAQPVATES